MPAALQTQQDYFPTHPTASAALAHLSLVLFPSTYSEPFLASCIQHWLAQPAPAGRWTTELLVEAVTRKLLEDEQEGGETNEAGRVVAWVERDEGRAGGGKGEIGRSEEVRKRWARAGGGKGKESAGGSLLSAGGGGGGKVEDVTLARNLALIRLHALFPLVPIVEIRVLLLSLEHTFLHQATEELLLRTQSSSSPHRKGGKAGGGGGVEVVDLAEVGRSVLAGLRSLFKPPPLDKGKGRPSTNAADGPAAPDPVLTRHDLFRPPSHTRTLLAHFTTLFPSLPSASVRRAVEEEGGSYAAIRAKLEVEAAERAARSVGGGGGGVGGRGKWWTGFGLFAPSSAGEGGAGPAGDVQREKDARRLVRESGNKAAEREVEAYYASIERRPRVRRVEGSERRLEGWISDVPPPPSPPSPPAPEADEDDPFLPPPQTVECQCCFADVPLPSSSTSSSTAAATTTISCDSPSSSHHQSHTFCPACLLSYTQTFLTGGTPLPFLSLTTFALPCFAASSPPCTGVLRSSTLRAGLDRRTLRRLEERIAAANLELLVAASATPGLDGAGPPRVHRCPFCPYAEIAPPASSSSGPLSRAFLPAWDAEWPPSVASLFTTIIGLLALAFFTAILSLFALLCPTPLPRLEQVYADLHPPPAASSAVAAADNNDPTPPPPPTLLPLALSTTLLLSPHHALPLSLAYVRSITERVVRRREGRRTVFRCRNLGRGGKKRSWDGDGEGEEWLMRLEEVEGRMSEYLSEEKAEGGGEEREDVEERRRRRLVEIVWGSEGLDALNGRTAEEEEEEEEDGGEKCGRLSCLLCSSPLNPSAPSLHRCSTISSPSSSSTTSSDKEQAEESLRLAVEAAMSDATARRCERCGAGVVKEGGCNKVTCRCGAASCWACRAPIPPSVGYRHFCQHFLADPTQACKECSRCSLWKEGDEKERVREAAAAARRKWALDHPEWAKKVDFQGVVVGPPAGLSEGRPLSEEILNAFERAVERVVSLLLAVVPLETT